MHPSTAPAPAPSRPRLRLESCRALLRQLSENQPQWSDLAGRVVRDPLLSWSIFSSLPLDGRIAEDDLNAAIEARLTRLGADLLRAWALQASMEASDSVALDKRSGHSLLVAELALHLANDTGYPAPQEAYLAGLWHELSALFEDGDPTGLEDGNRARSAERSAGLASRAGPGLPVLDAIRLHVEGEECVADGHQLARILWVAYTLAEAEPERRLSSLSRVVGLPAQTLLELRGDVTYLAEDALGPAPSARPGAPGIPQVLGPAPAGNEGGNGAGSHSWVQAAARGLMQGAFIELSENELRERLSAGCALLTGEQGPQLVLEAQGERFMPLLSPGLDDRLLEGLDLRTGNPNSTLTLAMRRGDPVAYSGPKSGPGRSTVDWQLDRWLGGRGFSAWPWQISGRKGVAIFTGGIDGSLQRAGVSRNTLLSAAFGELLRNRRRVAETTAQQEASSNQFAERARRMRHEASSPLSLIRSYLDLIRERHGADQKTRDDLAILGSEIDRVTQMLRRMTGAAQQLEEPPSCQANEVLRNLATLCNDTLFASRGIRLDLRVAPQLPPARIPRSILRQILLNLLRNAAEAVPSGGRVSLASSGPVSVDGRLCVELRVIDSGPGLPEGRLANLFADRGSEKGDGHEGIGLSIVRDLLHEYDSAMICRSQPGAGTGMQIFIPAQA